MRWPDGPRSADKIPGLTWALWGDGELYSSIRCATGEVTYLEYRIVPTETGRFRLFIGDRSAEIKKTVFAAMTAASQDSRMWYSWIKSKQQNPRSRHYYPGGT